MVTGLTQRRPRATFAAGLLLAAATLLIGAGLPQGADAATTWLCKPGVEPNPCYSSLQTTVVASSGASSVEDAQIKRRPRVDCFYVYPTVSEDPGTNADLSVDPQQVAIARYQASRFSERCRVFAPMYRQLTLTGINQASVPRAAVELAYSDVLAAWREYLRRYNKGRGVVLIGHSQGTGMLTQLVREQIDPFPKARRKLVSALLLGGNVLVKQGRDVGGVFRRVPGCRSARRTGCVVAYSTFDETPPADAVFGVPDGALADAFGLTARTDLEALCTNPAALAGGTAPLRTLIPTSPFPGTIGLSISILFGGNLPSAPTPWIEPQDHYTGSCVKANGANVLLSTPIGSARNLIPVPDPSWGLHLADVNLALGDLVDLVGAQTRSYLRFRAKRRSAGKGA
jgi:hypothetical protein